MATVTLYFQNNTNVGDKFRLQPQKLFSVDNIGDYLNNWTIKTVVNDVQYQKNALELDLKLDLSQSYSQPFGTEIVYVAINQDYQTCYYYSKRVEWRGKSAVRLELVMDVLNTFKPNTDYKFTERCHISREHRDRMYATFPMQVSVHSTYDYTDDMVVGDTYEFVKAKPAPLIGNYHIAEGEFISATVNEDTSVDYVFNLTDWDKSVSTTFNGINGTGLPLAIGGNAFNGEVTILSQPILRKIDKISEAINPVLYKNFEVTLTDKSALNQNWYLLYRNQNDPTDSLVNPVECYLLPEVDTPATSSATITSGRIEAKALIEGYYYYIPLTVDDDHYSATDITVGNTTYSLSHYDSVHTNPDCNFLIIWRVGNKLSAVYVHYIGTPTFKVSSTVGYTNLNYITVSRSPVYYKGYALFNVNIAGTNAMDSSWWYASTFTDSDYS